jgi:hypothetical protein
MSKRSVHVVPHKDGWAWRRQGNQRVSRVHATKQEAVRDARMAAKSWQVELVIHKRDGNISDSDSYGGDPARSRDRVR